MMIDRLEPRLQLASIAGSVFSDADRSKTFDANETAFSGVTVFIDANANGTFDGGEQSTTADRRGNYRFTGLSAGDHLVGTTQSASDFTSTTATPNGTTRGEFNIELRGLDRVSASLRAAIITAAERWEQVIVGDKPDVRQRDGSVIDDLVVDVQVGAIDGTQRTLAYAYATSVRKDYTAYRGTIRIDTDDLNFLTVTGNQLVATITHEIGHVLGIGTDWVAKQLITGRNSRNPRFVGTNAVAAYNRLFRTSNLSVPVENTGGRGTRESHWREDALDAELMTGLAEAGLDEPLSAITVGALKDAGYDVNTAAADDWNPRTNEVTFRTALDLGGVANERKVTVGADEAVTGLNLGFVVQSRPVIRAFAIAPAPVAAGTPITLTAAAITDADNDALASVSFWRESNGIDGLQKDGDTLIGIRTFAKQRQYRIETGTTGLFGEQRYYALATDVVGRSGRRTGTVDVQSVTPPTAAPTDLAIRQRSATVARFAFLDANNFSLTGYRIELATKANFGAASIVRAFNISGDTTATTLGDLRPGLRYYIRVRGFNLAGSSPYSSALSFETA